MSDSTQIQDSFLKSKTAQTLKWNTIDRVTTQLLYAVVGIVLANVLSKEDFGLVGALLIFQAFAILFVDSGFGAALLQKKNPTQKDYSTVFWFNLIVSILIYIILWFSAPAIARIFQNNQALIPLSKVMFLAFIINGLAIVQTNRLMKQMNVKNIAISNTIGLIISGGVGIWLALTGYGPWALVWQTISLATIKTVWLWLTGHWLPSLNFSLKSLKAILSVGSSVFASSLLNTICLNIYNFVVGAFYNLATLGLYTQADKWSKMGSASLSQIMTATFVPLLARAQDNIVDFHRYITRINRFAAFITLPALCGLATIGAPLFHTLFGNKWNGAIPLFQILCLRGIFVVLTSLSNNYLLALGRSKSLINCEIIKDVFMVAAILATINFRSVDTLVWGQFAASALTYILILLITAKETHYSLKTFFSDQIPFIAITIAMTAVSLLILLINTHPIIILTLQIVSGGIIFILTSHLLHIPEFTELLNILKKRFSNKPYKQ